MTRHLLDEVLDAKQQPSRPALPSVSGIRLIPRRCSCTWRLTLGATEATWTLTETDRFCPTHGEISSESEAPA